MCVIGRCKPKDLLIINPADELLYYLENGNIEDVYKKQATAVELASSWFSGDYSGQLEEQYAHVLAYVDKLVRAVLHKLERTREQLEKDFPGGNIEGYGIEFLAIQHLTRCMQKLEILALTSYANVDTMKLGLLSLYRRINDFLIERAQDEKYASTLDDNRATRNAKGGSKRKTFIRAFLPSHAISNPQMYNTRELPMPPIALANDIPTPHTVLPNNY